MPKIRHLTQDLVYPLMGLVSFGYLATHGQALLGTVALVLTVLYVVKSARLRKRGAAERENNEADPS